MNATPTLVQSAQMGSKVILGAAVGDLPRSRVPVMTLVDLQRAGIGSV
jgi:hypothetical protein